MDVTAPINQLSRQKLIDSVLQLGLVSDDGIAAVLAESPKSDGLQLGQLLITRGLLTNFQLEMIAQDLSSSLRMGNYDLLDRLGVGGMGTVYKARHRRMKRVVALKVLQPKLSHDPTFVLRFQREVETIARLGHPNIVMAYDADVCDGGHFLVMEFIDGKDLSSLVHRLGVFPFDDALGMVRQAARGLAYAHQQHVIHRDIKPANLLRARNGVLKVTDLGLARLATTREAPNLDSAITQAGFAMGTPDYMSPEQALGECEIDGRADIYSLGATLYYLLTGHSMYQGQSPMSIILQHRESDIPILHQSEREIPTEVQRLYSQMVQKDPADRFQNMDDVIAAIDAIIAPQASTRKPQPNLSKGSYPAPNVDEDPPTLQIVNSQPPTVAVDTSSETPLALPSNYPEGLRYLIIEPSRVQATIISRYLESLGITDIISVSDGKNALALEKAPRLPDVVISARHLPDIEGSQLVGLLTEKFAAKSPLFVLITSESDGSDTGISFDESSYEVLLKPFSSEQLKATIISGLEKRNRRDDSLEFSIGTPINTHRSPSERFLARRDCHVLIVDDSPTARTFERLTLEGLGFTHFTETEDGAQAIAAATRTNFDLILTDYNMPLMDGRALVSYLKQTPEVQNVPIIMVTSEKNHKLEREILALGAEAVIEKSLPVHEVQACINRLFPNR